VSRNRSVAVVVKAARMIAAGCALTAIGAQASPYELIYKGYFSTDEALNLQSSMSPTFFDQTTAFTINARFDDTSPNLAPSPPLPPPNPFDGYRAYAPSVMTIQIAGTSYSVSSSDNPGLTVSIFDQGSFDPGHYGVGIIVDAPADGAGIIGDFLSASPNFLTASLVPTVFTEPVGVGHASGVCTSGRPPECPREITPLVLRDASNIAWNLTLGNYEVDYPVQPINAAQIIAVPEPSTYGLMLAGLGSVGWVVRRRRR
jgi:hypothetical protein